MAKALVMFSGGLDSVLATKLLQEQGIEVLGINFYSSFFGNKNAEKMAKQIGLKLVSLNVGKSYLHLLKKPKHGFGSAINPCIDCKIFMLKKASSLLKKYNASFIATGEVLGERPMSQNLQALKIIEEESGLKGKLLRPLSAKLLDETEAEKKKLVDRLKLLDIQGRQRKVQIGLAEKYNIKEFPTPAGGCLLCEKEFAKKLSELMSHQKPEFRDIELLKIGRHFRFKDKIIVARNHEESDVLREIAKERKLVYFECKDVVGPVTILIPLKRAGKNSIQKAAELTAFYSDALKNKLNNVKVSYQKKEIEIDMSNINKEELIKLRI